MEPATTSGHRSAVVAAMLAAGALIAQQVAGRATRDALFLSTFHVSSLPLVMIAGAVASALAVFAFSAALSRRSPAQVVPITIAAGTALLLGEWGLSLVQPRLAAVAVYLHMAAFGATVVSGFWSLMNERFDPHTARRVMGDINLGASLGGVAGGMLAWAVAGFVPVTTMLAVMAAFNVLCLLALARVGPGEAARPVTGERRVPGGESTGPLSGLRVMNEVPYLRDLALVVLLGSATETLLDFVLSARATARFPAGASLMSFFALFHTGIGWLGLAVQMLLARPALKRLGLAGTVALRPATVAAAALAGFASPGLWSALVARGAHGVLNNSLFRSGYELLFTPIAERRKRPTKAIVDVGFDRLGTVVGSVIILALAAALGTQTPRVLFALAAAAALAALAVSRRLHNGYVAALEDSLRSGVVRLDLADVMDSTTSMTLTRTGLIDREGILREISARRGETRPSATLPVVGDALIETIAELRSSEPDVVRRALRRAETAEPSMVGHVVPLLARNDLFLDALRALRRSADRTTGQLLDALLDPRQDVAVRRRIPRVLRRTATQRVADGLLLGLADPQFGVRRQCALTLARITEKEPTLDVPRAAVFAATLRELKSAPGWSEEPGDSTAAEESSPEVRPQTPAERGLAHVFTLLSLAVEREPLQIAYWAVLGADTGLRGTALEYLENVLPDDLRRALWPHLGARAQPPAPAPAARRSRQNLEADLLRSSDTLGLDREALKKMMGPR